jgi:hypothetical protein
MHEFFQLPLNGAAAAAAVALVAPGKIGLPLCPSLSLSGHPNKVGISTNLCFPGSGRNRKRKRV